MVTLKRVSDPKFFIVISGQSESPQEVPEGEEIAVTPASRASRGGHPHGAINNPALGPAQAALILSFWHWVNIF